MQQPTRASLLARIKDRISLERENRDLRRRLQGGKGGPLPPATQYGGPPAPATMPSPVMPPAPPAQPTYGGAPALRPQMPAAPAAAAANAAVDQRVATMEDRLARMEELLRMAVAGRQ